jgi:hypothetical protein
MSCSTPCVSSGGVTPRYRFIRSFHAAGTSSSGSSSWMSSNSSS